MVFVVGMAQRVIAVRTTQLVVEAGKHSALVADTGSSADCAFAAVGKGKSDELPLLVDDPQRKRHSGLACVV